MEPIRPSSSPYESAAECDELRDLRSKLDETERKLVRLHVMHTLTPYKHQGHHQILKVEWTTNGVKWADWLEGCPSHHVVEYGERKVVGPIGYSSRSTDGHFEINVVCREAASLMPDRPFLPLVAGWVTVSGFDSQRRQFISVAT